MAITRGKYTRINPVGTNQHTNKWEPSTAEKPFGASARSQKITIKHGSPERDVQAMQLRAKGYTFDEIAATLGIGKETARASVSRQLERLAVTLRSAAAEVRELEDLRLDLMMVRHTELIEEVYADSKLCTEKRVVNITRLHDGMLRIMERRAKMFGIDAPVQIENKNANVQMSHAEMMAALDRKPSPSTVPDPSPIIDVTPNNTRGRDDDE
ncbi:MAG: hypothetical protein EOO77_18530 [Oxalobacteraceae bacterium]|nr:MAG: hypothetical protein EOO77_18530 [Oxalobacteraceae bacterium]